MSSREIERKTHADIIYVSCSNGKPLYRTIAIFKVNYVDLIYEAFKTAIKNAKNEDLIKF